MMILDVLNQRDFVDDWSIKTQIIKKTRKKILGVVKFRGDGRVLRGENCCTCVSTKVDFVVIRQLLVELDARLL